MENRLNMVNVLAIMAVAAALLLQSSNAQTTHVVGDAMGWVIPPGAIAYTTWAAKQNFTVGDILVFNFTTNAHDVAEVTKAAFDACTITNPISLSNTGPTNINLSTAGEHYYICTFGSHCGAGQKLSINVSAAAATPSPAPTPATTTPSPAPQPPTATPSPASQPPTATPSPPTPSPTATPYAPTPSPTATPPPTANAPSTPTTPSTPSPSSSTSPPPPNSAAPSFAAAALPVTLLSIAVALLH